MNNSLSRRHFISTSAAALITTSTSGCGTFLYPERIGQQRGGFQDVDWTVAGMNAVGLVFFFVPGVIAFAVDFYNGSLFYPPGQYGSLQPVELKTVSLPPGEPSLTLVETTVSKEIGKPVQLEKENFVAEKMSSIKDFWGTYKKVSTKIS